MSWFLWMIFPFLFCYFCIVCFRKLLFVNLLSDCGWVTVSCSRYKINILIIQSSLALYYLLAFLYQACSNSLYCIFCLFRFEFQKCDGERMPKCNLFSNFNMLLILLCIQLNVIYFVCCVNFNSLEYWNCDSTNIADHIAFEWQYLTRLLRQMPFVELCLQAEAELAEHTAYNCFWLFGTCQKYNITFSTSCNFNDKIFVNFTCRNVKVVLMFFTPYSNWIGSLMQMNFILFFLYPPMSMASESTLYIYIMLKSFLFHPTMVMILFSK